MRRFIIATAASAAFALVSGAAGGAEHVVTQKDGAFSVSKLNAKPGDEVTFRNDDKVFHNVFSLSKVLPFDLGAYGQGQSKKVKIGEPGKILVECAIHPNMSMVIDVSK